MDDHLNVAKLGRDQMLYSQMPTSSMLKNTYSICIELILYSKFNHIFICFVQHKYDYKHHFIVEPSVVKVSVIK